MTKYLLTLSAFLCSTLAFADANVSSPKVLYTCQPINPTAPISNVILEQTPDYNYQLSFTTIDSNGKIQPQSAPATYYDDMTYLGYGADSLNAALEFNYPIDLNE